MKGVSGTKVPTPLLKLSSLWWAMLQEEMRVENR
jgi:hypothetical protein